MTSETDVKACPFCGGEAHSVRDPERGGHNEAPSSIWITCRKCGARGPIFDEHDPNRIGYYHYLLKAVEAWNKRA
jgi:Lar family restriction alleviation protein